ncbi:MAG: HD domain-containing protein [Burkholderiales bacterium]|nr:HD domain-containing protein [Burkholderiales bacterium]
MAEISTSHVSDRLAAQLAFVLELDKLKAIERRTRPLGLARAENTAEHSWHAAMMAMALAEHAAEPIAVDHAVRILLVHDVVEIDADDTFLYDSTGNADKAEREQAAATRIFGLLPADQCAAMRALWDEYELRETAEARFAYALDRAIPVLLNLANEGQSWRENKVRYEQVIARNQAPISSVAPALWAWLAPRLEAARDKGWFNA